MWVVVKYKPNEFSLLKKKFTEILGCSPEFFVLKIKFQKIINNKIKTFEKSILEGYLLCHHIKFKDSKILHKLKLPPHFRLDEAIGIRSPSDVLKHIVMGFKKNTETAKMIMARFFIRLHFFGSDKVSGLV